MLYSPFVYETLLGIFFMIFGHRYCKSYCESTFPF